MKSKSVRSFIVIGVIPLGLLLNSPIMANSTNTITQTESSVESAKESKDAFEQASGMKRDQPTGPDPTPGEMKQQQPHNSNIEQDVAEAKEKETQEKMLKTDKEMPSVTNISK